LARLAKAIHYSVSVAAPEVETENFPNFDLLRKDLDLSQVKISPQGCIVVSTQGECDEEALEQAVKTNCRYIAFVASKTKAEKVFDYLREKGISNDRLKQVRAPAGLDIRAASPEEIAVSILAEIIQYRNTQAKPIASASKKELFPVINTLAKDPICGMDVDTSGARYKSEHQGRWFYFCCAGCKQTFDKEPGKYAVALPR
jgi:xanthine dehydrogenase accessory factor